MIRTKRLLFALLAAGLMALSACAEEAATEPDSEETEDVVGGKADGAGSSSSGFGRYSAVFCTDAYPSAASVAAGGYLSAARDDTGVTVTCPVADDSFFDRSSTTGVNVHVYDGHTGVGPSATACVKYYGWPGAACSANDVSSVTTGDVALSPSVAEWTWSGNAGHFAYVYVRLPARNGQQYASELLGYYVH